MIWGSMTARLLAHKAEGNEIATPNTKAFWRSRKKESISFLLSLAQCFVHAKAGEITKPGEERGAISK